MAKKKFDGPAVQAMLDRMPGGLPKMAVLQEAIAQADAAEDHFWRMMLRYDYGCEATFRDDPPKAIPVAAEFHAIYQEHPEVLTARSPDGAPEMHLMIIQMGIDPIVALPQIPMAQWEKMMDDFYALVKQYRVGLRTYWWQMCQFYQYVDREKAGEYFQKFWKTGRDGLSDCRACERSNAVRISLLLGDRAAADEYARPMEQGRIRFCSDTPQKYWLAYLEDALDRGDRREAEKRANALYRKADRDKSDLNYLGAVARCWAFTDPERAVALVEKRLSWTVGLWDQKKVYDFYKGAWVCFRELGREKDAVALSLPEAFPLYSAGGVYDPRVLADWFYDHAAAIGKRFDARNGADWFRDDLAAAERGLE